MRLSAKSGPRAAVPGGAAVTGGVTVPGAAAVPGGAAVTGGVTVPGAAAVPGGAAVTGGVTATGGVTVPGGGRPGFAAGLRRRGAAAWEELAPGRVVPADVRAGLGLDGGERVLSAGRGRDGECALVATDRALYHREPCGGQDGGWSRLGWEQVARVGWDAAAGQLIVIGAAGPAGAVPGAAPGAQPGAVAHAAAAHVVVPLRQRGAILELALERVAHTRLGQWQLLVDGRRRAVIEARRRPATGELLWCVTADGHGPVEPGVRARAERAIARLGAEFGAPDQPGTGVAPDQPGTGVTPDQPGTGVAPDQPGTGFR